MELLFHSEMSALDAAGHIAYVPIITRHAGGWLGKKGRIDKALLKERAITGDPDTLYFVCGPAGMVKDVRTMLQELGVSEDKIRVEDWRT
jgi:NAD(P)H-flavin reductase